MWNQRRNGGDCINYNVQHLPPTPKPATSATATKEAKAIAAAETYGLTHFCYSLPPELEFDNDDNGLEPIQQRQRRRQCDTEASIGSRSIASLLANHHGPEEQMAALHLKQMEIRNAALEMAQQADYTTVAMDRPSSLPEAGFGDFTTRFPRVSSDDVADDDDDDDYNVVAAEQRQDVRNRRFEASLTEARERAAVAHARNTEAVNRYNFARSMQGGNDDGMHSSAIHNAFPPALATPSASLNVLVGYFQPRSRSFPVVNSSFPGPIGVALPAAHRDTTTTTTTQLGTNVTLHAVPSDQQLFPGERGSIFTGNTRIQRGAGHDVMLVEDDSQ